MLNISDRIIWENNSYRYEELLGKEFSFENSNIILASAKHRSIAYLTDILNK